MIARLQGIIASIHDHHLVIDVGGVGYKVFTTPATLAILRPDASATLIIYTAVREDALDLYGFLRDVERRMFELLLSVSGIGPKSALAIVSLAGIDILVSAISAGKAAHLTSVSGIGKKTAEKIVLELKDKIDSLGIASTYTEGDEGAVEALRGMGYSIKEAREALQGVPQNVEGESARLREALRAMGK